MFTQKALGHSKAETILQWLNIWRDTEWQRKIHDKHRLLSMQVLWEERVRVKHEWRSSKAVLNSPKARVIASSSLIRSNKLQLKLPYISLLQLLVGLRYTGIISHCCDLKSSIHRCQRDISRCPGISLVWRIKYKHPYLLSTLGLLSKCRLYLCHWYVYKKTWLWDRKLVPWVRRGPCYQAWWAEVNPWDPCGGSWNWLLHVILCHMCSMTYRYTYNK